jgi:hypothetical protein
LLPSLSGLFRLLLLALLLGIVAYYLYRMRDTLMEWWRSLFGPGKRAPETDAGMDLKSTLEAPPKPFSSFQNPLGSESDPRRVIVITFQAFDAWARENGLPRRPDETTGEFVERIQVAARTRQEVKQWLAAIEKPLRRIALAYDRIVFGKGAANRADLDAAEAIWSFMTRPGKPIPA